MIKNSFIRSHYKNGIAFPLAEDWFAYQLADIHCELHASKSAIAIPTMAVGLQKDSQYLQVVQAATINIVGSGHLNRLEEYNMYTLKSNEKCTDNTQTRSIDFLSLFHIFSLLFSFMVLSSIVAVGEYFWSARHELNK